MHARDFPNSAGRKSQTDATRLTQARQAVFLTAATGGGEKDLPAIGLESLVYGDTHGR